MTSNTITVRLIQTGMGTIVDREIPAGTSLNAFCQSLNGWAPSDATHISVNGRSANMDDTLNDGDEIALSPARTKNA